MRCYRKILRFSYQDHVTNEEVRAKDQQAIGPHEDLLTIVKRRKLSGMDMSRVHKVGQKPSCEAQWKGEEDKADRKREHQVMDRPGVCQVLEGGGEQRKMEETGC